MTPERRRPHPLVAALIALALFSLSRPLLAAPSLAPQARHVVELLAQWRQAEAEKALTFLLHVAPDDPAVRAARAEVAFHQGRYAQAAALLAPLTKAHASPLRRLDALARSTAATVKGYRDAPSAAGHFILRVHGRDDLLVPFAAETLEAQRRALAHDLGFAPPGPIVTEVYPHTEDLAKVSPLTEEDIRRSGTIALCKYHRLMIVSPRALLYGYTWRDTLAHEYTHLVVSSLSHNRVPIWLHEGLAKFFETRWRREASLDPKLAPIQRHLLAEALATGKLIPWKKMHPSMAKLPSQRATALAFAEVQTAMSFIATRAGVAGLRRLILAIRDGKSDWQAIQIVTGLDRRAFTRGWRRYLRGLRLKRTPDLTLHGKVFSQRKETQEQRVARLAQAKARRHFRLGDMLRRRGLRRAAILQYEKARAAGGRRESVIAGALARTYLEISRPQDAIAALLPVVAYYPELPGAQATLGAAYLAAGDRPRAIAHLEAALGLNPFDPQIHCDLAKALARPTAGNDPRRTTRGDLHRRLCARLARP